MKTKDPIEESRRYVDNANYEDPKYVRAAGHYLWLGVLMALETVFHLKTTKKNRVDIDDYKALLTKWDKKLLTTVNNAYNILHLSMTYDGVQSKNICNEGFVYANDIIDRCANMMPS